MVSQCAICLSSKFKEPVCTPCGHVYCQKCLIDHVNVPTNQGMTSSCPECRTEFPLVAPDLRYLPEKYHPFIQPAIRRIYADMSADVGLQKKLKQAEKTLLAKTKMEEMLLKKCEGLAAALEVHRQGERDAVAEAQDLEEKIEELELEKDDAVSQLNDKCYGLEEENARLKEKCRKWATAHEALQKKLKNSEANRLSLERKLAEHEIAQRDAEFFNSLSPRAILCDSDDYLAAYVPVTPAPKTPRPMKPMPRRRLMRTRDEDTSISSLSASKRARISDV